jgi:hypothetical protein
MYGDFSHMHILEDLDSFTGVLKGPPGLEQLLGSFPGQVTNEPFSQTDSNPQVNVKNFQLSILVC